MAKKKKVSDSHKYMFTCVAKINAYRNVGKIEDARDWAQLLVKHLKDELLLVIPVKISYAGDCPDCNEKLIAQPRGGVKCSKCPYWFCF